MPDNLCQICNEVEATQTNSHLLSQFMTSGLLGGRTIEQGFLITPDPDQDYSINVGASEITSDFIFCRGCEQRLAYLESYISQEMLQKMDLANQIQNFPIVKANDNYVVHECLRLNAPAFHLFIASVLYRLSKARTALCSRFRLKQIEEEYIQEMLDSLLPPYANSKVKPNKREWLLFIQESAVRYKWLQVMIVTYFPREHNSANFVFMAPGLNNPYSLMLNEFMVFAYFGPINIETIQEDVFLVNELRQDSDCILSISSVVKIVKIHNSRWQSINKRFYMILKRQRLFQEISRSVNDFRNSVGHHPSPTELSSFMERRNRQR